MHTYIYTPHAGVTAIRNILSISPEKGNFARQLLVTCSNRSSNLWSCVHSVELRIVLQRSTDKKIEIRKKMLVSLSKTNRNKSMLYTAVR